MISRSHEHRAEAIRVHSIHVFFKTASVRGEKETCRLHLGYNLRNELAAQLFEAVP